MQYGLVLDNGKMITFDEWHKAVVFFYDKITGYLYDVIELYDSNKKVIVWVRGKGIITKS